ncbi:RelA/SpoT family protein [Prevotella cerevisiae]|jgi:GTP pyrophosphokinase|uniref:RelA/SpoT family protein n=1 Tax=Segatella cerevisiae TaxID=2053716 RepID=A0ABT1BT92_9BACT|nr:RelA/SpoT family protein [Segatella cerevisiae]MCH3993981.1 RelA/SpoT family protein [Prevotella sp.]MCO6024291.1 RelA/SpoT family protein [Segatella cerevisiae]
MDDQNVKDIEREQADNKMITDAFQHLLDTYLASRHRKKTDIIIKAFNFSRQAHKGVRRLSGEPYIMHPIAVAQIACEDMGLGSTSICSALLHDVVEDTDYTIEDIQNIFGDKIAQIVEGLTKISGGIFGDNASAQAENFKKLLLTMSDDIRVILIKICDRLHNMRTLASQSANRRYKIAGETLYIYAPLANRLGLNKIKTELEDLSFRFEHPEEYEYIESKLTSTQEQRDTLFSKFTDPIKASLDKMGISYTIKARVKSPYSIWCKMQNKHVTFDEIYDILAVRIIYTPKVRAEEINECFQIYVAICKIYKSHPDRLRDWVNHPKANGYQALHVTLMSKQGRWIEVQIRSDRMDEIAEQGFAAHWKYKEGGEYSEDEGELNDWLRTIKEILDDPQPDAMDFLDSIKLNLFASEIFVFTPKGEIKTMPAGSTALDFAFEIHTFLGSHCIGAKVNHKLVPLSQKLQSGDQVEILTSKAQHVQPSWMNFASTAKAKSKITAILRHDNREIQYKGKKVMQDWLQKNDLEMTTSTIDKLRAFHDIQKPEDFFQAIGDHTIILGDKDADELHGRNVKESKVKKWRRLVPFLNRKEDKNDKAASTDVKHFVVDSKFDRKKPVIIDENNINQFLFKSCCHPIPGDDILGYIDNMNHIEIHKRACPVANKLKSSFGNRIVDAKWDMHKKLFFDATIEIQGIDRKGMLLDVAKVISGQLNVGIHRMTINSNQGIFDGRIEISIHDRDDVKVIMNHLKAIPDLQEVQQIM